MRYQTLFPVIAPLVVLLACSEGPPAAARTHAPRAPSPPLTRAEIPGAMPIGLEEGQVVPLPGGAAVAFGTSDEVHGAAAWDGHRWSTLPYESRDDFAAVAVGNRVAVICGADDDTYVDSLVLYALDGTTTRVDDAGGPTGTCTATSLRDGRALVVGDDRVASIDLDGHLHVVGQQGAAWDHVAARLPDGRVLVAGGVDGDDHPLATAVAFGLDGSRASLPPMPAPRDDATAVALPDGRIAVFGGRDAKGSRPEVFIYDPTSRSWTTSAPLRVARADPSAVSLGDGRVLVTSDDTPPAELWSSSGSAPAPLTDPPGAMGALSSGRVLLVGGRNDPSDAAIFANDRVHRASPGLDPVGVANADGLLAIGGTGYEAATNRVARREANGTWTELSPVPGDFSVAGDVGGVPFAVGSQEAWSWSGGAWVSRGKLPKGHHGDPVIGPGGAWWVDAGTAIRIDQPARVKLPERVGRTCAVDGKGRLVLTDGTGKTLLVDHAITELPPAPADAGWLGWVSGDTLLWFGQDPSSAAVLDEAKGSWRRIHGPVVARDAPGLARMADGSALLFGGTTGEGALGAMTTRRVDRFDPRTRTLSRLVPLQWLGEAVWPAADGTVEVVRGAGVERYDPKADPAPARVSGPPSAAVLAAVRPPVSGTGRAPPGASPVQAPVRQHAAVVQLGDGGVLVIGGEPNDGFHPVAQAVLYAAGKWWSAGTLRVPRYSATAVRLGDAVLVLGGSTYEGATRSVERWQPGTGFRAVASLPWAVSEPLAVRLPDGRLWVAGSSDGPVAAVYDPAADHWHEVTAPADHPDVASLLADGRVLCGAGSLTEVWNPQTDTWAASQGPPRGLGVYSSLDLLADGRVLAVGSDGTATLERDGTWVDRGTHVARFRHSTMVLPDGRVAVLGGVAGIDVDGDFVAPDVDPESRPAVFDPKSNAWSPFRRPFPSGRFDATACVVGDSLVVVGGKDDPGAGAPALAPDVLAHWR